MSDAQKPAEQNQAPQAVFGLQKIYIKDISFETPNSPKAFTEKWEPAVNMELHTSVGLIGEHVHEVVLRITITAKLGEMTVYLAEVNQAGIFMLAGFPDPERDRRLAVTCPGILFPYAREVVSDLVSKGGFPQLLLAPVSFEVLYAEHLRQKQGREPEPPVH
jgi:preprotein translocase subunit SecB